MTISITRKMLGIKGRIGRRAFWAGMMALWAVFSVLFIFMETTFGRGATLVLYPPFFWIAAVLMGKRFHDRDKSAWWCLMVAIPVLGPLWLFWQLAIRGGSKGDNRFGANPRTVDRDYLTLA